MNKKRIFILSITTFLVFGLISALTAFLVFQPNPYWQCTHEPISSNDFEESNVNSGLSAEAYYQAICKQFTFKSDCEMSVYDCSWKFEYPSN